MKLYNKAWSVIKGWPLAWMLLLTGASLVFNNSHYQIAAKKSPPNQGSNEEIFEMRTKPVPDKIFNLVLTSDVKMKEASDDDKVETNEKNNKIAHLDWIAIESYRATRDAADETKNISDYTLWGFWASLLAVFFSFIGIVLVKRTLDAANKANTIAQDTAENTNRAWCYPHIDNDKTGLFEHPYLIFKSKIVNKGITPAFSVNAVFYLVKHDRTWDSSDEGVIQSILDSGVIDSNEPKVVIKSTIFPSEKIPKGHLDNLEKASFDLSQNSFDLVNIQKASRSNVFRHYCIACLTTYKTAFSSKNRSTFALFKIDQKNGGYVISELSNFRNMK